MYHPTAGYILFRLSHRETAHHVQVRMIATVVDFKHCFKGKDNAK